jgi:hypothetical protein
MHRLSVVDEAYVRIHVVVLKELLIVVRKVWQMFH